MPVRLRSSAPVARVPTRGEPAVSPNPRAVVLLSGGLDSATALAIAKTQGFDAYALSFRYGQRHAYELEAARRVAAAVGASDHVIATIDLRVFGGSALTSDIAVPKHRPLEAMAESDSKVTMIIERSMNLSCRSNKKTDWMRCPPSA